MINSTLNIYEGTLTQKLFKQLFIIILITAGYYLSAKIGLFFVSPQEKLAAFWPPSGYALSMLLLFKRKFWIKIILSIFLSNLIANYTSGNSFNVSLGFALVNSIEPLLVAIFLTLKLSEQVSIKSIRYTQRLLIITPMVILFTSLGGALVTYSGFNAPYWASYYQWFLADTYGIYILTPFLLSVNDIKNTYTNYNKIQLFELFFISSLIIFFSFLIFSTNTKFEYFIHPLFLIPLLFILALRHNIIATTTILLIFSSIAILNTVSHGCLFCETTCSIYEAVLELQIFLGFTIISSLLVTIFSNERKTLVKSLEDSLEEKKWLLREVNHRVKNNMSMILSFLTLQSDHTTNTEAKRLLMDSENRIRSITMVQNQLYQDTQYQTADFKKYIKELVDNIMYSFDGSERIKISFDLESILISPDQLIQCGLILNEAITNSLKYAFEKTENPEISIHLSKVSNDRISLSIRDNGRGLPGDLDDSTSSGLGLKLIKELTRQIDGKCLIENKNGTTINISFPASHP